MKKILIVFAVSVAMLFSCMSVYAADTDREVIKEIQTDLNVLGFDCGTPDGILGAKTKSAIKDFQKSQDMEASGTIDDALIRQIDKCVSSATDSDGSAKGDYAEAIQKVEKELEDQEGKGLYYVFEVLDKYGYTASYHDKTFHWLDGERGDPLVREAFKDEPESDLKENRIIKDIYNIDHKKKTLDIDFEGKEPGAEASESSGTSRESLNSRLNVADAWIAMDEYGHGEYPYGYDLNYLWKVLAEEPYDSGTWFLRAECTIEDADENTVKGICEACVSGTSSDPKVEYFQFIEES